MRRSWPLWTMLVLAGCAASDGGMAGRADAGGAPNACFWPSQVSGFSDAGPDKALARIGTIQLWELTLARGCPNVDWALRIGIVSRGGQTICPGRPAELIVPEASGNAARRCLVSNVRRLSAEEVEAALGKPGG